MFDKTFINKHRHKLQIQTFDLRGLFLEFFEVFSFIKSI